MRRGFVGWLDRFIYVDKLKIAWRDVLPQMRWWEWVWYVVVVFVSWNLLFRLNRWIEARLDLIPVLRWAPFLVTWPFLIVLYMLVSHFLLPARSARAAAKNEGWLVGLIMLGGFVAEAVLFGRKALE